jgi:hypothetical protein
VEQRKDHMPMELVEEEVGLKLKFLFPFAGNTKIIKFTEVPAAKIPELLLSKCFRK